MTRRTALQALLSLPLIGPALKSLGVGVRCKNETGAPILAGDLVRCEWSDDSGGWVATRIECPE